jgi:PAS domain S-box-containing protein
MKIGLKMEEFEIENNREIENPQKASHTLDNLFEKQEDPCLGWEETFDSALDIIALISADFKLLKLNKAGYENIGKKPEELLGKKCYEVVHGLNSPIKGCPCEKTLKTKKGGIGEIYDHGRCYIATSSPIEDKNSEIIAFVHTFKDITERKKAEENLKEAYGILEQKVEDRTAELLSANKKLMQEIEERKQAERALKKSESELQKKQSALVRKNIALGEVIAQIEVEKRMTREDVRSNIEMIIFPLLEKLKIEKDTLKYVNLLQHHLETLTSSYSNKIIEKKFNLTPREIEICHMVKAGFANKDISNLLNISRQTIEGHRKKIRQKLGIANKEINLSSYLRGL